MNIVILATARGLRPASFRTIRDELAVDPVSDVVTVVCAHRPYRPLPVDAVLWAGADYGLRRHATELPVAPHDVEESDENADDESAPVPPPVERTLARRLAHGVAWRARRVRFAVNDHPVVSRARNSTKVRKATNAVFPGGISARFAANALQARNVQRVVSTADVVIALDTNSHRAAWILARRHPGPDVVVGTAAGRRVIAARRASA